MNKKAVEITEVTDSTIPVAEDVITEKKVKVKQPKPQSNNISVMYIGPSITHVVQKSRVFKNGVLPEALKKYVEEHPYIRKLLVPIDALPAAMSELNKKNSALNVISEKVKRLGGK